MATIDYAAEAELLPTGSMLPNTGRGRRRQPDGYGRFARVADAIRFAIEELQPKVLLHTYLKVDQVRFDSGAIRQLYESAEYPLPRKKAA
jgi:hypothetical protein